MEQLHTTANPIIRQLYRWTLTKTLTWVIHVENIGQGHLILYGW